MPKPSDPKIEAYIASKQVSGEMTQRTAAEYRRDLERMGAFLEKKSTPPYYKLYDATKHDVNIFLNQIRESNTIPSANRKLAAIKGFFQFLVREGYRNDNPTAHVQLPKVGRALRESVLTRQQINTLLDAPSKNYAHKDFGLRDRAMLHFLYSGPKRQELCDARVSDVDIDNKTIAINGRTVPLSNNAAAAIGAYLKVRPETAERALFITERNEPMKVRNAWVILKKHVTAAKLPKTTDIETLRASYAVHALEDGVSLFDVLAALGTANRAILQNYARLANLNKKSGEAAVDDAINALNTLSSDEETNSEVGFISLLHPRVIQSSLRHYKDEDYREAVLNAMLALTETIRAKTGLDGDGWDLSSRAFKPEGPLLEFSDRATISGNDEHKGFHKIMLGAFEGVRNPKSHRMFSDLTPNSAAQYLVFISLLVRRVEEAKKVV